MLKALKVTMILYAVVGILFGLGFVVIPDKLADWFNLTPMAGTGKFVILLLGAQFIVTSAFLIMAAWVARHILWVKWAIAHACIDAIVTLYAILRDYGDFSQIGVGLVIHAVFFVLLLIFYPWKNQAAA